MRWYSPNISSIFMEHKILTMNVYCRWNSVLVVAFIVQLFAFSGIKAANWNKKRTKRCILPISMLPDLNAEHLYFAPSPLSLFKMGEFYGNIIEPSDQTSFAQTIVIMTSQLFHLSHNDQTFASKLVDFWNKSDNLQWLSQIEVGFAANGIWCENHSADCFETLKTHKMAKVISGITLGTTRIKTKEFFFMLFL